MPIEISTLTIAAGQAQAFELAFADVAWLLRTVEGCQSVTLLRGLENPDCYQVQVRWRCLNDHTETYARSEQATLIRALLRPLLATSGMNHFEPVVLARPSRA